MANDRAVDHLEVVVEVPTPTRRGLRSLGDLVWGALSLGAGPTGYRDSVEIRRDGEPLRRWVFDRPDLCEEHAAALRRDLTRLTVDEFHARWVDGAADE